MQKLHLVGFTTDHEGLILSARRGARSGSYLLKIDGALEEAVDERRARREEEPDAEEAASSSRRSRVESALPVREIQARLRQGRTIADVARAAGVDAEWVERFAPPVLAERAKVIEKVRSVPLRRARLGPSVLPIGEAVRRNLADRGVSQTPDEFADAWTARQMADGRWVVRYAYHYRGHDQTLRFDLDDSTGEVSTADRTSGQLGYVAPRTAPAAATSAERARPSKPAPEERPVVKRAVVSTGFRPDPTTKAVSRSAKERERAAVAMRKAAAKRAIEGERAAARKLRERREAAARREREEQKAAARAAREAAAAQRAAEAAAQAKKAATKRAAAERAAAAAKAKAAKPKPAKKAPTKAAKKALTKAAEKGEIKAAKKATTKAAKRALTKAAEKGATKATSATKRAPSAATAKVPTARKAALPRTTARSRAGSQKARTAPSAPRPVAKGPAHVRTPSPIATRAAATAPDLRSVATTPTPVRERIPARQPVLPAGTTAVTVRPDGPTGDRPRLAGAAENVYGTESARAMFRRGLVEQASGDVPVLPTAVAQPRPAPVPNGMDRPRRTRPLRAT